MDIGEARDAVLREMGLSEMPSFTDPAVQRLRKQIAARIGEKVRESNMRVKKEKITRNLEDFYEF